MKQIAELNPVPGVIESTPTRIFSNPVFVTKTAIKPKNIMKIYVFKIAPM